jgi:hypothetical protein
MAVLEWDGTGQKLYEAGVDHAVLYIPDGVGAYVNGYAWNGITAINEAPTGGESNKQYADNQVYLDLYSREEFAGSIEAYTYPDAWAACDGSDEVETGLFVGQQERQSFGLSFRTLIGNDVEKLEHGYKLTLVYGATASPSEKNHTTLNESPEATALSWDFTTIPVAMTGKKPTSVLIIDSTKVDPADLAELEDFLYGTVGSDPSLPSPDAVRAIFADALTEATPTEPAFNSGTDTITVPTVTGVVYKNAVTGAILAAGALVITEDYFIKAVPATGYKFPPLADTDWSYDYIP